MRHRDPVGDKGGDSVRRLSIQWRPKKTLMMIGAGVAVSAGSILPAIAAGDSLVNTGSADPATLFAQNKQNEPAMAIDANHPNVVVAGSNDEIDLERSEEHTSELQSPM